MVKLLKLNGESYYLATEARTMSTTRRAEIEDKVGLGNSSGTTGIPGA
jgi:hypothetical protein